MTVLIITLLLNFRQQWFNCVNLNFVDSDNDAQEGHSKAERTSGDRTSSAAEMARPPCV